MLPTVRPRRSCSTSPTTDLTSSTNGSRCIRRIDDRCPSCHSLANHRDNVRSTRAWMYSVQFLCSTFGSAGDVFPMLGLALALRERGHDIVFATNGHFESLVRAHGLAFDPLGTEQDYQDCL